MARVRVFAVECWGCAGTHWLARALDGHPQIRCFHAVNGAVAYRTGTARLDGPDYADLLNSQRLGHPLVGDVHGFSRETIASVQEALGDAFRCAVLVRDPLPRYRSQLALFKRGEWRRWAKKGRLWDIKYVLPIARAAGIAIPRDYDEMLVVHAASLLNVILEERALGPVVRMEDLVARPQALQSLVATLSGGEIEADAEWAERAINEPPLAQHSQGEGLTRYELDAFERVVKPEAWAAYRELGYDC